MKDIRVKVDPFVVITDDGDLELNLYVESDDTSTILDTVSLKDIIDAEFDANTVMGEKRVYRPCEGHPEMMLKFAKKLEKAAKRIYKVLDKPYEMSQY